MAKQVNEKKTILCAQSKLMQTCASALFAQHPAGCCRNTPGGFSTRCRKKRWRRSLALIWNTWEKSNAIAHSAINHNPAEFSVSAILSLQRPSWCACFHLSDQSVTVFKWVKLVVGSEPMPLISRFKTGCFIYLIFKR